VDSAYRIVVTDAPNPADVQVVREGLDAHSAAHGAPVDWVPLMVFVRDPLMNGALQPLLAGKWTCPAQALCLLEKRI